MKIQFDIKYRPEIESGKYTLETNGGYRARIICWDMDGDNPIVALVKIGDNEEMCTLFDTNGHNLLNPEDGYSDLLIVTDEQEELTEFGKALANAFYKTIGIVCMDGMEEEARKFAPQLLNLAKEELENRGEPIFTEASKELIDYYYDVGYKKGRTDIFESLFKSDPELHDEFLSLVRKELSEDQMLPELTENDMKYIPEELKLLCNDIINHSVRTRAYVGEEGARKIKAWLKTMNRRPHKTRDEWEALQAEYERGKSDALKDLPRWENVDNMSYTASRFRIADYVDGDVFLVDECLSRRIRVDDLLKLPGNE